MKNNKFFWINLPIVYLLQFLDALSTNWALKMGFHEANPVMETVVQNFGLSLFVKFLIISLVMATVYWNPRKIYGYSVIVMHQIMMFLVVYHNFFVMFKKLHGLD